MTSTAPAGDLCTGLRFSLSFAMWANSRGATHRESLSNLLTYYRVAALIEERKGNWS
jgi:hypothetical protein